MKDKRSNMVWLAEDDPLPEVLKTGFRSRKRMFTIFNTQGPVVVDIMPYKATITATYYTTSVLLKVLLHNQSMARLDVGLESSCIKTMQLLTKLLTHRRTLMTMASG